MSMMTIERFDELATAYGAEITLWPIKEQAAAQRLAGTSDDAHDILVRERALDAALDEWQAPEPSQALMSRILGDAAEVSTAPTARKVEHAPDKGGFFSRFFGEIGWRPVGAMTACLAIGMVAGFSGAPSPFDTAPVDYEQARAAQDTDIMTAFFGDEVNGDDPFDMEIL